MPVCLPPPNQPKRSRTRSKGVQRQSIRAAPPPRPPRDRSPRSRAPSRRRCVCLAGQLARGTDRLRCAGLTPADRRNPTDSRADRCRAILRSLNEVGRFFFYLFSLFWFANPLCFLLPSLSVLFSSTMRGPTHPPFHPPPAGGPSLPHPLSSLERTIAATRALCMADFDLSDDDDGDGNEGGRCGAPAQACGGGGGGGLCATSRATFFDLAIDPGHPLPRGGGG